MGSSPFGRKETKATGAPGGYLAHTGHFASEHGRRIRAVLSAADRAKNPVARTGRELRLRSRDHCDTRRTRGGHKLTTILAAGKTATLPN